jgi:hypothetical protein
MDSAAHAIKKDGNVTTVAVSFTATLRGILRSFHATVAGSGASLPC